MESKKNSNFLISVVVVSLVIIFAVFLSTKFFNKDENVGRVDGEINKVNEDVNKVDEKINKVDGYNIIDFKDEKVLIKCEKIHTFSDKSLLYLGEYKNKIYFRTNEKVMYYSLNDNKEHLWFITDDYCNDPKASLGVPCNEITAGKIIGNKLYYFIQTAAIGEDYWNSVMTIELDAESFEDSVHLFGSSLMEVEFSDDNTKIYYKYWDIEGNIDDETGEMIHLSDWYAYDIKSGKSVKR